MKALARFAKMVTFWELAKGLGVTTKYLVKPKVTELYPDKRPVEFLLNQEHCLHCGLCVDPCPTGSIHHSHEFELVVYDYRELLFDRERLPYDLDQPRYRWNVLENARVKK